MKTTLYHISNGSLYLQIVKIRYKNDKYMKCKVNWYYKPSLTFMTTENNLKIPLSAIKNWDKITI